jgi:hypothetical protein
MSGTGKIVFEFQNESLPMDAYSLLLPRLPVNPGAFDGLDVNLYRLEA